MIWLGVVASALALTDTLTSAMLQRRGYVEKNPLLGPHPSDVLFGIAGMVAICVGWFFGLLWHPLFIGWALIEGYEVQRNVRFLLAK